MKTRSITLVSLFVAVMIAFGALPTVVIPFIPVPFTFQMLGVMLVGSILGARKGLVAMLVFTALAAAGVPVLSGYRGGLGVLLGPTGGYVLAWPLAAFVIGLIADYIKTKKWTVVWYYVAILAGILVIYLIGVPWFAFYNHLPLLSVAEGNLPLFLLDLVKAGVAAVVASQLKQRLSFLRKSEAI
ncbi:biotin transporter BioY [Sporolactobacillus nakayamae]|uniref:Biotin transporter n=1 Tax=Sporolactobacillus nakayamae TaxID=269670 RepID=A0A1I2T996_9BACL|nr:biotin transporter BioY [Sporolactobacillus nakayamae]SFG60649.1 biotin transport system substrate-specific component [Sporolactobacillus nakayamae]